MGGTYVESLGRLAARLIPLSEAEASDLVEQLRLPAEIADRHAPALADILVKIGALAESAQGWLEALDLNPIVVTPTGLLALDARCIVRPEAWSPTPTEA
jgi:acetyltransferase